MGRRNKHSERMNFYDCIRNREPLKIEIRAGKRMCRNCFIEILSFPTDLCEEILTFGPYILDEQVIESTEGWCEEGIKDDKMLVQLLQEYDRIYDETFETFREALIKFALPLTVATIFLQF